MVLSVLAGNGLSNLFILNNMYNVQVFEKLYSITKSEHWYYSGNKMVVIIYDTRKWIVGVIFEEESQRG